MATILYIGNLVREDYLGQFAEASKSHKIIGVNTMLSCNINEALNNYDFELSNWNDYSSVQAIFKQHQPDYVVCLQIENFTEVIARLICREKNIPFYLLDHGIYVFTPEQATISNYKKDNKSLYHQIQYKLFHEYSVFQLNSQLKKYFKEYKHTHKQVKQTGNGNVKELRKTLNCLTPEAKENILPDIFITYSDYNFEAFKANHSISDISTENINIGFPNFDDFKAGTNGQPQKKAIFIDQPLTFIGLTEELKINFYNKITDVLIANGYKVYIKPQPNNINDFKELLNNKVIVLDSLDEVKQQFNEFSVCIGFYSTLLLPFIANKNCRVFSYKVEGAEIAHIYINNNLAIELDVENFSAQLKDAQIEKNNEMVEHIMYKLDGNAGKRLSLIFEQNA